MTFHRGGIFIIATLNQSEKTYPSSDTVVFFPEGKHPPTPIQLPQLIIHTISTKAKTKLRVKLRSVPLLSKRLISYNMIKNILNIKLYMTLHFTSCSVEYTK